MSRHTCRGCGRQANRPICPACLAGEKAAAKVGPTRKVIPAGLYVRTHQGPAYVRCRRDGEGLMDGGTGPVTLYGTMHGAVPGWSPLREDARPLTQEQQAELIRDYYRHSRNPKFFDLQPAD